MSETIELCDNHKDRVDAIRETAVERTELSELTDAMLMDILLDTYEAVDDGLYKRHQTPDWKLEELIDEWREQADREAAPEQWALEKCADDLEKIVEDGGDSNA